MKLVSVVLLLLAPVLTSCAALPRDCSDIYHQGNRHSGVYTVCPDSRTAVQVYCDLDSEGGRWTVFQRRIDGSVNFFRGWNEYKRGFGNAAGEYWLGLAHIHTLTKNRQYELLVDMEDFHGRKVFSRFTRFSVGSESDGYVLHVSGCINGGAGDSINRHNGHKFSTYDKDQDSSSGNCAAQNPGAFWYHNCLDTNPNGIYLPQGANTNNGAFGVVWSSFGGFNNPLKTFSMKIRPVH